VLIAKDGNTYLKYMFSVRKAEEVVILSSIALLRPNARIQSDILSLCLQQPENKERLRGFVSGAAIPRIVVKDFRTFLIMRPPDDVQQSFMRQAEPLFLMALELDEANLNLQASRDLLLSRLISREIDVADLAIDIFDEATA
jgi:type I restriction enzyme S subunit